MDVQRACIHSKGWTDKALNTDWLHSAPGCMAENNTPVLCTLHTEYTAHPRLLRAHLGEKLRIIIKALWYT